MARETTTLGELISLQRGYDLTEAQRRPGPVPVVGSAGVHGYHDTARASGPGVTLGRSGAAFGKVTFTQRDYWPHNTTLFVTDFKGNEPLFIRYLLESLDFSSLNSGSAQQSLNRNFVYPVRVAKPPLPLQRRIAGILSAYDDLVENCQRRIRILEEMARSLYREWFVDFRFPGHETCPRVPSPPLGEIPEGWEGQFSDIATIGRDGINPLNFPSEEFEHFSIPSFDDGCQETVELGESIRSNKYVCNETCVLLSKLNPHIPRIWLPSPSGTRRAVTSTEFLVLEPRRGFSREYIYSKCCSERFSGRFSSLAIGTSTSHQRVKPDSLLAMACTVPDQEIIEKFTIAVSPMFHLNDRLRRRVHTLRRTRDLLLPRLLSGQVELEVS